MGASCTNFFNFSVNLKLFKNENYPKKESAIKKKKCSSVQLNLFEKRSLLLQIITKIEISWITEEKLANTQRVVNLLNKLKIFEDYHDKHVLQKQVLTF